MTWGRDRYGEFGWGTQGIDRRVAGRLRQRPNRQYDGITDEDRYGAGIALNTSDDPGYDFDFKTDERGRLVLTKGHDELRKDIAYKLEPILRSFIGTPPTAEQKARMEIDAVRAFSDERIDRVRSLSIADSGPQSLATDVLVIEADLVTVADEQVTETVTLRDPNAPNSRRVATTDDTERN